MFEGKDIVDLAITRKGQRYVLGARVNIANPDWSGPWDCAEFVSWACYHAYGRVIAVRPPDVRVGESYSGWWYEDAIRYGGVVKTGIALATAGAILVRKPGDFDIRIGHVAISRGDNSTIEAHSSRVGVDIISGANTRKWTCGFLVPGVSYGDQATPIKVSLPAGIVELSSPYMRGGKVRKIQDALLTKGVNPGALDGVYGPSTAAAVAAFQAQEGLVVDGVVGPETRKELGL
jgi:N-acetylmuramoyl-L-alanine amidase